MLSGIISTSSARATIIIVEYNCREMPADGIIDMFAGPGRYVITAWGGPEQDVRRAWSAKKDDIGKPGPYLMGTFIRELTDVLRVIQAGVSNL